MNFAVRYAQLNNYCSLSQIMSNVKQKCQFSSKTKSFSLFIIKKLSFNIIKKVIYMNSCNCPSGCELVTLASTLSCILAKNLSSDDINTLGDFFSSLGSNLSLIADAQSACENNTN